MTDSRDQLAAVARQMLGHYLRAPVHREGDLITLIGIDPAGPVHGVVTYASEYRVTVRPMSIADFTDGRHPSLHDVAQFFETGHLPPDLAKVSGIFESTAKSLLAQVEGDHPELTVALRKLLEAKDAAVRAAVTLRATPAQVGGVTTPDASTERVRDALST